MTRAFSKNRKHLTSLELENTVTTHLKIKIKSLAAEATIIRKEERKALKYARWKYEKGGNNSFEAFEPYHELRLHRVGIVRSESRYSGIAYAFLREKSYSSTEKSNKDIDYGRLIGMINRFKPETTPKFTTAQLEAWIKG